MTVKDLFRLVFKSIGLLCAFIAITTLISLLAPVYYTESPMDLLIYIAGILLVLILIYLVFFVFVDQVIHLLNLDKGFDNQQVNLGIIKTEKVFEVVLFTLGMINIITVFPDFIHWIFSKFQNNVAHDSTDFYTNDCYSGITTYDITYDLIYLAVGILVIILRKQIIKLIQ